MNMKIVRASRTNVKESSVAMTFCWY